MPTNTTNYGLLLPLVNNATDQDLWGGYLNTDLSSVDTMFFQAINAPTVTETTAFSVTAPTAASSTLGSSNNLYLCNAASAAFTASLPAASTCPNGFRVVIKKTDSSANAVTIAANGTDLIDGNASIALSTQYAWTMLVCNGSNAWEVISSASVGNVKTVKMQTFTANGTYTPSAGMIYCEITAVGSGAGGGSGSSGGGGGGGATIIGLYTAVTIGASQAVTIGAAVTAGSAGNTTRVGALLSAGGGGAPGTTIANSSWNGATGGAGSATTTGGNFAAAGTPGGNGNQWAIAGNASGSSGQGGNSFIGGGGSAVVSGGSGANGNSAVGYGGGGSGAIYGGTGGAGGGGIVIIKEFCSQ